MQKARILILHTTTNNVNNNNDDDDTFISTYIFGLQTVKTRDQKYFSLPLLNHYSGVKTCSLQVKYLKSLFVLAAKKEEVEATEKEAKEKHENEWQGRKTVE